MRDQFLQLLTYARGMWRYRWYGLILTWCISIIGWVVVYSIPDKYAASTRVQIERQSALEPLLKGLAVDTNIISKVALMTRVLMGRENLENIINNTDLKNYAKTPADKQRLIVSLRQNIKIGLPRRRGDAVYTFRYSHTEAYIAKQVIEDLLKTLVDGAILDSLTDKKSAQNFIVEQLGQQEVRLTVAEEKLAQFKKKNVGMMPSDGQGYYARLQLSYEERDKLRSELRIAKNKYELLDKQLKGEAPAFAGDSDTDKKIRAHTAALDELLLKYTEQYPDVIAKRAIIAQLRKKKARELTERAEKPTSLNAQQSDLSLNPVYQDTKIALSAAEVEVKTIQSKLNEQNIKIRKYEALVDTIPEVEAQLSRLNRDYTVIKTQYEALLGRLESAKLSAEADKGRDNIKFKIIDPPFVPVAPASPNRMLLMFGALLAGIASGLGLMFVLYMLRPVFITTQELNATLGLPVLGSVKIRWSDAQKEKLKFELTKFMAAAFCLIIIFSVVLIFRDSGSYYLQEVVLGHAGGVS
ncbi:hypothetical protein MNBD_GAMMA23-58 [hydrothermal vent metagenome]|uniref:Tyrosine-protein kinase G-rich domain-containing protein n=1 Tax=hydrothermal vent metagenome TaxID=652676 RepID=A0A3B1AWE8_9ZZZZ